MWPREDAPSYIEQKRRGKLAAKGRDSGRVQTILQL